MSTTTGEATILDALEAAHDRGKSAIRSRYLAADTPYNTKELAQRLIELEKAGKVTRAEMGNGLGVRWKLPDDE